MFGVGSLGQRVIYRMTRTGGSLHKLASTSMFAGGDIGLGGPAWSPDSTKLALEECVPDRWPEASGARVFTGSAGAVATTGWPGSAPRPPRGPPRPLLVRH